MENLRGFDSLDPIEGLDAPEYAQFDDIGTQAASEDDSGIDTVEVVSGDERRMQVRAYNFWTANLGDRSYPAIEDLHPEAHNDFADFSVLLDFTSGIENPSIPYLGDKLRTACDLHEDISYLDEVPARSLLSRITDHYLQIIANRAPIGFEAEFVNEQGANFMYRGILLPYSSDDDTIDFIYGVINWKEVADDATTHNLQAEVVDAMREIPQSRNPQSRNPQSRNLMPAWGDSVTDNPPDDEPEEPAGAMHIPVVTQTLEPGEDYNVSHVDPDDSASLADWLLSARNLASDAETAAARSRDALYSAIGRAWDFALVARDHPEDYAELLKESGIALQERAPMTPIVKLVFGAHYDKTRLTEFAAALSYAQSNEMARGAFGEFIRNYDGGLKAIVKAERQARKVARGGYATATPVADPRSRLRAAKLRDLADFAGPGEEFVLLVARRGSDGSLALVGAVEGDEAFTEKALSNTIT